MAQQERLYKDKEWLFEQYITLRKSTATIAKEYKASYSMIRKWLIKHNIKIRSRSEALKGKSKSLEHAEKIRQRVKKNPTFLNKKHSEKTKKIMSINQRGSQNSFYGKNHNESTKAKWNRVKENNPNWKGGISKERALFYETKEWKKACRMVWKRDNSICQKCNNFIGRGSGINFHIHHIISFKVKELRANPNNLLLLCKDCHYWIHSNKNIQKDFILKEKDIALIESSILVS